MFEQGDARVTRQFGGLGLGRAIAKAVVEMHGGVIRAASAGRGAGATFTVEFENREDAMPPEKPRDGDMQGGGETAGAARILLVEDHADTAKTFARLLRGSGFVVKTADSVAGALAMAGAEAFDVVVSDIGLPDATGYELMRELRRRHGLKGIALSGYGMEEDVRRSREAGFSEHMVKPVNVGQFEVMLRRVLSLKS